MIFLLLLAEAYVEKMKDKDFCQLHSNIQNQISLLTSERNAELELTSHGQRSCPLPPVSKIGTIFFCDGGLG